MIQAPKFYLFDIGIVNYITHRRNLLPGSIDYGHALEHLMLLETIAYLSYSESDLQAAYWRTASGFEVDIIIFEPYSHDVKYAIEVKSCEEVQNRHLKGLGAGASSDIVFHRFHLFRNFRNVVGGGGGK